jgi:hypothetical protein
MAYLVFKGVGFWRKKSHIVLRDVRTFRFLGFRRVLKSERYVSKKAKVLLFQGGSGSGKTRELLKLSERSKEVWGLEGVYIPCGESLENWFKRAGLSSEDLKGLRQFEKVGLLISRLKGKAVFLDDVDRVDSKVKLDAVKWLIRSAGMVVCSCRDVYKIQDGIEYELRKKLKLKAYQGMGEYVVDLGGSDVEVKDVGMIVAIVLIVFVAFTWGLTFGLMGALALKYVVSEGRRR